MPGAGDRYGTYDDLWRQMQMMQQQMSGLSNLSKAPASTAPTPQSAQFNYPMPMDIYKQISGLPMFGQQQGMIQDYLKQMQGAIGAQSPFLNQYLGQIGQNIGSQQNILGQMGDPGAFQSAVRPQVQQVMKELGRSGLASGSHADRTLGNTLGSLWNQWQWNTLQGYGNLGQSMPGMYAPAFNMYQDIPRQLTAGYGTALNAYQGMGNQMSGLMGQWYQPYNNMLNLLAG